MTTTRRHNFSSILGSLILAGIFCFTLNTYATYPDTTYAPGDTLNPNCSPGAANCTVTSPESAITAGTTAQYWRGDKSWQTLNQAAVAGLTTSSSPTFAGVNAAKLTNLTSNGLIKTSGGDGALSVASAGTDYVVPSVTSLSSLASIGSSLTGILKASSGSLSAALAGTDYENPLTFTASDFNRVTDTISLDYTNGQAATGSTKGFLTSADWTTFNGKEPAIAAGSSGQYWSYNKSWQTLNQAAVAGLTTSSSPTFAGLGLGSGSLTTTGTGTFGSISETTPTLLKLDQTTAQTISNGKPYFSAGLRGNLYSSITTHNSQYPPAQSGTYVKATTYYANSASFAPYLATTPTSSKSLIGSWTNNAWISAQDVITNQRFQVDLGSAKTIVRVYYENSHNVGTVRETGVKDFTLWGCPDNAGCATAFLDTTYISDANMLAAGWVSLSAVDSSTGLAQFTKHTASSSDANSNVPDPQYITVSNNSTPYRYYAFKFANTWTGNPGIASYMGLRQLELQTQTIGSLVLAMDGDNRKLYGTDGTTAMLDYSTLGTVNFGTQNLTTTGTSLSAIGRFTTGIKDNAGTPLLSIDTGNRKLYASDGTTAMLDYSNTNYSSTYGNNFFFAGAVNNTTTGSGHIVGGKGAGALLTTGLYNILLGTDAGSKTNATGNIMVGYSAGKNNTTGRGAVFIGNQTGLNNTTGDNNIFIGETPGYYNTTGAGNIQIDNGSWNRTGGANTTIGNEAASMTYNGSYNTTYGALAWSPVGYHMAGNSSSCGDLHDVNDTTCEIHTLGSNNTNIGMQSAGGLNLSDTKIESITHVGTTATVTTGIAITGITRVGSVATATYLSGAFDFVNGQQVTITGAVQAEYNGTFTISNVSLTNFTYTVTGTPATPATGTIHASGHNFVEGQNVTIVGASDPLYNGDFSINTVTANTFKYNMAGTPLSDASPASDHPNGLYVDNYREYYYNTALGYGAGGRLENGQNNVFLGYLAGSRREIASNLLIIDNQDRTSSALEQTNSLVYGTFNAVPALQNITFNGRVNASPSGPTTLASYAGNFTNTATNTTTDGVNKYGLYVDSSTGSFTGSSGAVTSNYGIYITTTAGADAGHNYDLYAQSGAYLSTAGVFNDVSSKELKENYTALNKEDILYKIDQLPIMQWNYKVNSSDIKHIGPFSEDFYSAFGVGDNNKTLSTIDPAGIALVGVQAVSGQIKELKSILGLTDVYLSETGVVGDGTIVGVDPNNLFIKKIKGILAALGLKSGDNGIEEMQMVDKATGDIYCTWIENGNWEKKKGKCVDATKLETTTPSPTSEPSLTPSSAIEPSPTPTPTSTATPTSEPSLTPSSAIEPSPTPTPTSTATPTSEPTPAPSPTPEPSPTQ